jgi:hypothetical protein
MEQIGVKQDYLDKAKKYEEWNDWLF